MVSPSAAQAPAYQAPPAYQTPLYQGPGAIPSPTAVSNFPIASDARLAGDARQTRFILDLDKPVQFRAFTLADPYRVIVDLTQVNFQLPAVSALAVAVCLFTGIAVGHPGGGLIAGGGAFTIGFGANQRIADSRLIPMIAAVIGCSTARPTMRTLSASMTSSFSRARRRTPTADMCCAMA